MMSIDTMLLSWYDDNKRDLPWRRTKDPYRIWVSEVMLQQTQVETVKAYYERFLAQFPTVQDLACAPEQAVLKAWEGLGYYSRARSLHRAAMSIVQDHSGMLPGTHEALRALPGIGEYTAGAIASIAFDIRTPAVDGNVTRVLARLFGVREDVGMPSVRRKMQALALETMPINRVGDFNQALMELGACVCTPTSPECACCPLVGFCDAYDAGEAHALPYKQKAAAKRIEQRAVLLHLCNGRIFVQKREERLLKGMWEFPSLTGHTTDSAVEYILSEYANVSFMGCVGEARHVFTHLVWEMQIMLFHWKEPAIEGGRWVTADELLGLPFPTALKVARGQALSVLHDEHAQ